MRILVTNQGQTQLSLLKIEHEAMIQEREKAKERLRLQKEEKKRQLKISKRNLKSSFQKFIHDTNVTSTVKTEENIPEINVKQKKIPIPKSISEQYNLQKEIIEDSIITPALPLTLTTSKKFFNIDGTQKKFINVKDILKPQTVNSLKDEKLKAKRVKELNTVINNNNFRTNYAEKDVLVDLFEKLDVEIDTNKINLIRYLHSKSKVSEKFINQFESFTDEKLNKLNKICQIITYKTDLTKVDKQMINEKLRSQENKLRIAYKEAINHAYEDITISRKILDSYKQSVDKKAIYGELLRKTKMVWEKNNTKRLQRKTNKEGFDNMAATIQDDFGSSTKLNSPINTFRGSILQTNTNETTDKDKKNTVKSFLPSVLNKNFLTESNERKDKKRFSLSDLRV